MLAGLADSLQILPNWLGHLVQILKQDENADNLVLRLFLEVLGKHGIEVLTAGCQVRTMHVERLSLHQQLSVAHQRFLPQSLKSSDYCNSMLGRLITPPMLARRSCRRHRLFEVHQTVSRVF